MNYRNPVRLPDGRINVEIEHPDLGWVPFTADAEDVEQTGREIHAAVLASAAAGEITVPDAPPPPVTIPQIAPKLALVRAMRLVTMDGTLAMDGETSVWDTVKVALAESSEQVQEDWGLVHTVPRDEPIMLGFAASLPFPPGVDPDAMIDRIYVAADMIDRGAPHAEIEAFLLS